jgi:hypothetical protein
MNVLKQILPDRFIKGLRYMRHGRLTWDCAGPSDNLSSAMTTEDERDLFTESAKDVHNLRGEVVDLGCWLGSTTISLAKGLRDVGDEGKVHAFDLFTWDSWMDDYSKEHWCDYRPGESFLPETRRRVGEYLSRIELIPADLTLYRWEKGPIRLLLVDAMKTWELATAIAREFYPSMLKGGLVIQQDYLAFSIPWIPIQHYRLREFMSYERCVKRGATVSFRVVSEMSPEVVTKAGDFSTLTHEEAEAAFTWTVQIIGDRAKAGSACHRIMYYLYKNELEKAISILRQSEAENLHAGTLAAAKKALLSKAGKL